MGFMQPLTPTGHPWPPSLTGLLITWFRLGVAGTSREVPRLPEPQASQGSPDDRSAHAESNVAVIWAMKCVVAKLPLFSTECCWLALLV